MRKVIFKNHQWVKRTGNVGAALILPFALLLMSCSSPTSSDDTPAPEPSQPVLSLEVHPSAVPADGASRMVVFVEFRSGNTPVSDSTEVILLNSIGTLGKGVIYTSGGVALDTLTSDTTAGLGWLIAYSQGYRDSLEIMFTETP